MKYTETIEIDLPRERVAEMMADPDGVKEWMPELVGQELIEGERGQEGAKTKMRVKMGKREVVMIETVTRRDLPDSYTAEYDAKGVWNEVENRFEDVGGKTRLVCVSEFRFSGFMKVIGFLFKGAFPKETRRYLKSFKDWAESEGASKDAAGT